MARKKKPAPELSEAQATAVRLMKRASGATRAQLVEALPDNKATYVTALLYRILADKGIKIEATRQEGTREVVYKIG